MKASPTYYLFSLSWLLLLSCTSLPGPSALPEKDSLKLAIVPCEVLEPPQSQFVVPISEQTRLLKNTSASLQAKLYEALTDHLEETNTTAINLQPYSETNALLDIKEVSLQEGWQLPSAELARLLKVDAILRVAILETDAYYSRISGTWDNLGVFKDDDGHWGTGNRAMVSAGLFEGTSGIPLWSIGQPELVNLGRKHEVIARRLVKKLSFTIN